MWDNSLLGPLLTCGAGISVVTVIIGAVAVRVEATC